MQRLVDPRDDNRVEDWQIVDNGVVEDEVSGDEADDDCAVERCFDSIYPRSKTTYDSPKNRSAAVAAAADTSTASSLYPNRK